MIARWLLPVAAASLAIGPVARAANTVAYVNYQFLLEHAPQTQASVTILQKEFSDQKAKIKTDQSDVAALQNKFLSLGPETNSLERASVFEKLKKARKTLDNDEQGYEQAFSLRRDQLAANLHKLAGKEIQSYARAHGFSIVLGSKTAFAAPAVDITNAVLERLKADYQAAQKQDR